MLWFKQTGNLNFMLIGPMPIVLFIIGSFLYIRGIYRRKNVDGINVFSALCISTFLCSLAFSLVLPASTLAIFSSQCIGSAFYIVLLNICFSQANIGKRNFIERSPLSKSQIIQLCIFSPIIVFLIDYFMFYSNNIQQCRTARCYIFENVFGSNSDFRDYYLLGWVGTLLISATISSALQLVRFKG
ncbi:hypothetical protein EV132_108126 [Rhizobium sullae]|uniref:Uncharacterized protein n=1 Tax=Rhizobium sullae TaxID=50338 RepID=A0A4R3Q9S5_RHISU|nr:hypothetical protein EV132_108126 [Rhizobium sullae]